MMDGFNPNYVMGEEVRWASAHPGTVAIGLTQASGHHLDYGEWREKAEDYLREDPEMLLEYVRQQQLEHKIVSEGCKEEIERLKNRKLEADLAIETMRERLGELMDAVGIATFKTPLMTFKRAKNPPKLVSHLDPEVIDENHRYWQFIKVKKAWDVSEIKEQMKNGSFVPESDEFEVVQTMRTDLR